MQLQKEVKSNLKHSPAVKKVCGLKNAAVKRCEIQSGSQEMVVMVG